MKGVFIRRLHLIELEDQRWFPAQLRNLGTDFIRFVAERFGMFRPVIPRFKEALIYARSDEVLDLCSGGGGPVAQVSELLEEMGWPVRFTLTDKYPNLLPPSSGVRAMDGSSSCLTIPPFVLTGMAHKSS